MQLVISATAVAVLTGTPMITSGFVDARDVTSEAPGSVHNFSTFRGPGCLGYKARFYGEFALEKLQTSGQHFQTQAFPHAIKHCQQSPLAQAAGVRAQETKNG